MNSKLIKCITVKYRKGYIEVIGNINVQCINIESWNIRPEYDMSGSSPGDEAVLEDAVVSHTELELSVKNAEELIQQLKSAIKSVKCAS